MQFVQLSLQENYWEEFNIREDDLEYLYNHLLEKEIPQTSRELAEVLIRERILKEIETLESKQKNKSEIYFPKEDYSRGDVLRFPALEGMEGKVVGVREGRNPGMAPFGVIDVDFGGGKVRSFASKLVDHSLNNPIDVTESNPELDPQWVIQKYGNSITACLSQKFTSLPDLVQIAGAWFPKSLLVDVNIGYMNLAEAVLEMEGGGPLNTCAILEQVELPTDTNQKLTEFSMNYALQEDERFDEVGPSGETLWFLRKLEPDAVQNPPLYLRFQSHDYMLDEHQEQIQALNSLVYDELEAQGDLPCKADEIEVSLIYPHWRAGTIPLSQSLAGLFPTAYEAPRVKFTFLDEATGKSYPGWVVRPQRYVYGLQDWYKEKGLIPGSLFRIKKGKVAGEVILQALSKHPTKEWIRTVLVGADNGVVFTMLKQQISNDIDERMVIAVPDTDAVDKIWELTGRQRGPLETAILNIMRELGKLSPQGHVHAQELYAAVNIVRRCPPGLIMGILLNQPNVAYLGDLYFRFDDQGSEE